VDRASAIQVDRHHGEEKNVVVRREFLALDRPTTRMVALPNQLNCWTRRPLPHYRSLLLLLMRLLLLLAMSAFEFGCSVLLLLLRAKGTSFLPPLVGQVYQLLPSA
jgi:hypothetical protein